MSNLRLIFPTALLGLILAIAFHWSRSSKFPTINHHRGDFTGKKARADFISNSKALIAEGVARFKGPFRIVTTLGYRVILPASFTDWVKKCNDLDHPALVADEFFADYPGFEGVAGVVDPGRLMSNLTKTKLSQSSLCSVLAKHILEMLDDEWADQESWHVIEWAQDVPRLIGRMSAAAFVGETLARDAEWQTLVLTYTVNLFNGVRALRNWPAFSRPLVHWFLPECRTCRAQVKLARSMLHEVLEERHRCRAEALADKLEPKTFEDALAWTQGAPGGLTADPAAIQLAFAISAMHTTSELLKQTLLDICTHPDLMQAIRTEVSSAVVESGWTTAGLAKMKLLDSVIKETQRLKPGSLVNLERKVLRDVVLPNGDTLERGTNIAIDTSRMWDENVYSDPQVYNGYRFFDIRLKGGPQANTAQLVSVSPEHMAFGLGKPVCPGRFFAANEIKIALATILVRYDVRLPEGHKPQVTHYGFEMLSDPASKIEVIRRKE